MLSETDARYGIFPLVAERAALCRITATKPTGCATFMRPLPIPSAPPLALSVAPPSALGPALVVSSTYVCAFFDRTGDL
jgi:hypothetical protein